MSLQQLINKRNNSLKVVITWGLYATPLALNFRESIDNAKSHNPKNGLEKIFYFLFYFLLFTIPWAMVVYVIHFFKLIYYQISIWNYKKKEKKKIAPNIVLSQDKSDLQEYGQFVSR